MYIPEHFEERDLAVLQTLVRAHSLGTWVSEVNGVLEVNHLPFILDDSRGQFGTLVGHVARANAIWKVASSRVESVVVFQGPQGYITPSWYASKHDHGRVVPTWNYAVVHAHGTPRVVDDRAWLLRHVAELTSLHESGRETPWQVSDAPPEFIEGMVKGIVGIEIPIVRLVGKWKVSQNRSVTDRLGVVAGLQITGDDESRQMAQLVQERTNRTED